MPPGVAGKAEATSHQPVVIQNSVLIIQQTREVHLAIEKFLNRIKNGDPSISVPDGMIGGMGGMGGQMGGGMGGGTGFFSIPPERK